jgi:hypothetical protein
MSEGTHDSETVQVRLSLLLSQHEMLSDIAGDFAKLKHYLGGYNLDAESTTQSNVIIERTLARVGGLMLDIEGLDEMEPFACLRGER